MSDSKKLKNNKQIQHDKLQKWMTAKNWKTTNKLNMINYKNEGQKQIEKQIKNSTWQITKMNYIIKIWMLVVFFHDDNADGDDDETDK